MRPALQPPRAFPLSPHPCVQAADGGSAAPSPLPAFYGWAQQQVAAGRLQFEVKGDEVDAWEEEVAPAPEEAPGAAVAATSDDEVAACKGQLRRGAPTL